MLPAHIIEYIRERENRISQEQVVQPTIELPLPPRKISSAIEVEEPDRGVLIIEL